ncbi:HPr family phosphocarrier protein [Chloroflexi bacterium TSY]|nr:HPr family phosphocarrier protein [Chloroflexi bacterium TSY]
MTSSISTIITIENPLGLHLRRSRDVVQVANQFRATITAQNITRTTTTADVKSILQLMQLQAHQGHKLHFHADGPDASEAIEALRLLLEVSK